MPFQFRRLRRAVLAVAIVAMPLFTHVTADAADDVNNDHTLWYTQPAVKWEEALPVGSGRLGAMVFGGTATEDIQYNEDTLWTGKPRDYTRAGAHDHLDEIRKLIFNGKQDEAANLFRSTMISDPVRQKAYQPFGDLRFTFAGHDKPTDYRRLLDLDTATAVTTYTVGGVDYRREVIASYPDNVIAVHITASQPGKVAFSLKMDTVHKNAKTVTSGSDTLVLTGFVVDPKADNEPGTKFESRARVIASGGSVKADNGAIVAEGANSATVLLVAATSFVNFQDVSGDPAKKCGEYMSAVGSKSYETIKATQVKDHQALYRRVTLDFGRTNAANKPTDERIKLFRKDTGAQGALSDAKVKDPVPANMAPTGLKADPAFVPLFFNYGRYLLIGCSRPGTQPANLQGVWNSLIDPPWESKYTTNINVEMNYWPAELTNLSETHQPLFDLVDDMRVTGARTAKAQYGARGWVLHHNTDVWRGAAPINNIDGMWPTGGAWLCHHLWEHYQFTGDREFLAKRAYPAMKEAATFFIDFLVKDPKTGWLVTNPSHSPEQGPLNAGPAMDMQLIRALFDYTTEAAHILGVDSDFVTQLADVRAQLVPDQIGKYGQLQEWKEDWDEPNNGHRHMSPLWGLYPGNQFSPTMDNPKIYEGAKLLLQWRADGSTGWSYAWRIPLWARVGDGEFAYRQLALQLGRRTLPNCFDLCGPFQIDGNFGATAGVAELLLQSHQRVRVDDQLIYVIDLLPALPSAWPKGSFTGLKARGGFEVDLAWADGKVSKATIRSLLGNPVRVAVGDKTVDIKPEKGDTVSFDGELKVLK